MAAADDRAVVAEAQVADGRSAAELVAAYLDGVRPLRKAVAGLSAEELRARPVPGKMSTLEVLSHVADCEQFLADRMKRTIATDRPLLMGVDGIRYLDALSYHERDPELDLELVDVTRRQMAADLERLSAGAWERTAVHSEIGLVTLRGLLLHSVSHLERHVRAIEEKRAALEAAR